MKGLTFLSYWVLLLGCLLFALPAASATDLIAYVDGEGDLYLIQPDGKGRRNLASGEVLQPIFLNQNYLVIGVNKKTDADLTEYAKQRDTLMQQALTDRKNQVFGDYLTSVMSRMKQSGSIKVYQDVLDTVAEEEPQAPPQRRPQLPIKK